MKEASKAKMETVCKVQLDQTGTSVLIYNEDKSVILDTYDQSIVETVREGLRLSSPGKVYVETIIDEDFSIEFGKVLPEQDW